PGLFLQNNMDIASAEAATDAAAPNNGALSNIVARNIAVGAGLATGLADVTDAQIETVKTNPNFGYKAKLYGAIAANLNLSAAADSPSARTVSDKGASVPSSTLLTSNSSVTTHTQGMLPIADFLGAAVVTTGLTADADNNKLQIVSAMRSDPNWQANASVGNVLANVGKTGLPPTDSI